MNSKQFHEAYRGGINSAQPPVDKTVQLYGVKRQRTVVVEDNDGTRSIVNAPDADPLLKVMPRK